MNKQNSSKSAADNLALIRADYEGGLCSKRKIAQNHNISSVTLWRYASEGNWKYGWKRDQLMQEVSEASVQRLMASRADTVEDHAIALASIREQIMNIDNAKDLKVLSKRVDTLLECIKAERLCFGLPSEVVSSDNAVI